MSEFLNNNWVRKVYTEFAQKAFKWHYRTGAARIRKLLQEIDSTIYKIQSHLDTEARKLSAKLFLWVQKLLLQIRRRLELWQKLLYIVRFFCFFPVFPNNLRHLCTTMPWTIWPALAVLWGVCWMFYEPSGQYNEAPTAPAFGFYPILSDSNIDWSESGQQDTIHSTLLPEPDPPNELQQDRASYIQDSATSNAQFNVSMFGDMIRNELYTSIGGSSDSTGLYSQLVHASDMRFRSTFFTNATAVLSPNAYGTGMPNTIEIQPAEAEPVDVYGTTISSSQREDPLQNAVLVNGQDEPLLNGQGRMICKREGCEDLSFNHRGEWKKHMDRHNRPYNCSVCMKGFGSKSDLQRHRTSKHRRNAAFFCNESGCGRSQLGFTRKDHLAQHIRQVHKRNLAEMPNHGLVEGSCGTPENEKEAGHSRSRKRKCTPELTSFSRDELIEEVMKEREKRQRLEHDLESQREKYKSRIDSLLRRFEGIARDLGEI